MSDRTRCSVFQSKAPLLACLTFSPCSSPWLVGYPGPSRAEGLPSSRVRSSYLARPFFTWASASFFFPFCAQHFLQRFFCFHGLPPSGDEWPDRRRSSDSVGPSLSGFCPSPPSSTQWTSFPGRCRLARLFPSTVTSPGLPFSLRESPVSVFAPIPFLDALFRRATERGARWPGPPHYSLFSTFVGGDLVQILGGSRDSVSGSRFYDRCSLRSPLSDSGSSPGACKRGHSHEKSLPPLFSRPSSRLRCCDPRLSFARGDGRVSRVDRIAKRLSALSLLLSTLRFCLHIVFSRGPDGSSADGAVPPPCLNPFIFVYLMIFTLNSLFFLRRQCHKADFTAHGSRAATPPPLF